MKKIYLLCLMLICSLASIAQDFEITSVESLPNDFAAREEMKTDHNDRQCALLRVATQNIAPEQREGFTFKTDLGSEIVERANRNGEIWLWVSPGLKYLRIMHRDMGQYELHLLDHVARVEALHTYKVVLRGTQSLVVKERGENTPTQQYLMFQVMPANAMLEVDGQLWSVDADGTAMKYVDFGTYNYRVMASDYFTETGKVTVNDPENTQIVPVSLKPNFAEITLVVDADAEIWVNNQKKGTHRWTGSLGNGTYKIECKQANHETSMVSKEITPSMNGQTITLPTPTPIYGSLNIESTPNLATIYIDGKEVGKTPKSIPQILIGHHELKLSMDGYAGYTKTITVAKGERTQIKAELNNLDYVKLAKKGDEYYEAENYEEALKCYREAAEVGDAAAQFKLGIMYDECFGINIEYAEREKEAVKWYRMAAENGCAQAQFHWGKFYDEGYGHKCREVKKDNAEAVKWYRKAAEQGFEKAQYNLGVMYQLGEGVEKDLSEAVIWYQKAAAQGNKEATRKLATINKTTGTPQGALSGKFSISPTKQVCFSQGNLQYQASTNTWRFAEHQWDYIGSQSVFEYEGKKYVGGTIPGSDNNDISEHYNGWIDLFGWGTSGWNSGSNSYQPWSNSIFGYHPGGESRNSLTRECDNADWGVFNAITNGGNRPCLWRTMTRKEWYYLLNERNTTSDIRYAKAKVNDVNGIVLLPDNWNKTTYKLQNVNNDDTGYSSNKISASQWINLERAGAVFMPAAGERYEKETKTEWQGWYGFYWTASVWGGMVDFLSFGDIHAGVGLQASSFCGTGRSVRLVCPVEN